MRIYIKTQNNVDEELVHSLSRESRPMVQSALNRGGNINLSNSSGVSLLMFTVQGLHVSIKLVEFMLENGADYNAKDNKGLTAVDLAIANSNYHFAKLLIKKGANFKGLEKGSDEDELTYMVKCYLLREGIKVKESESPLKKALEHSFINQNIEDVFNFLVNGANLEQVSHVENYNSVKDFVVSIKLLEELVSLPKMKIILLPEVARVVLNTHFKKFEKDKAKGKSKQSRKH